MKSLGTYIYTLLKPGGVLHLTDAPSDRNAEKGWCGAKGPWDSIRLWDSEKEMAICKRCMTTFDKKSEEIVND